MAQVGSFCATWAKVSFAFSYQNEWSIATALLNCGWTDGSHETGKFTLPSFPTSPTGCSCSCWAMTGVTKAASQERVMAAMRGRARRERSAVGFIDWLNRFECPNDDEKADQSPGDNTARD